ncbi:MAG: bifunctional phosphopantothenoylcysteine decarboxylase/phosphopantothenate--cysteine ligase CoaBC [Clostridiales bacterium]|jgi:phosphopantothenoylcysteine decarboxylase|nr:bifunctional phosphopantothenoylcysteine decarboxylase/phosphopantothenate--cysteine ligase CoaBC [Clostridiales bacterium]
MNIVLGVTGSIAAYKAADIISRLKKLGHEVDVILTESGSRIITPITLQTLSKNKVYMDMFEEITPKEVKHISLAEKADLMLIAPATANIIGKIANGIADDFLSTVVMAAANTTPVYIAPAMNTNMYENPIVQANIEKLRSYGYRFIEPKESLLACGTVGKGALADVDDIIKVIEGRME